MTYFIKKKKERHIKNVVDQVFDNAKPVVLTGPLSTHSALTDTLNIS